MLTELQAKIVLNIKHAGGERDLRRIRHNLRAAKYGAAWSEAWRDLVEREIINIHGTGKSGSPFNVGLMPSLKVVEELRSLGEK
jgi:hypothetical protein